MIGTPPTPADLWTYRISRPRESCYIICPVEGCPMREMIWSALQNQFVHCPIQEMVVVLEEGYHPLMLYPKIDNPPPLDGAERESSEHGHVNQGGGEETQVV